MIEFILGFTSGLIVSYIIVKVVVWSTLRQLEQDDIRVDELIDKMKQKIQSSIVQARLEEHQGVFYLYRVDNDEFIAQGRTHAEVEARAEQRIPNLPVYVTQAEESALERYRATKNPV
jgi:hypothetical protein